MDWIPGERIEPQRPRGKAQFMLIAEAPSYEEMDRGIPLIGPSGRVLDGTLRMAGIDRARAWVTNVVPFQLPDNNWDALFWNGKSHWAYLKAEADAGRRTLPPPEPFGVGSSKRYMRPEFWPELARLRAEIKEAKPDAIITLGAPALWSLTGLSGIGSLRGAWHFVPGLPPIMPTYHPAHLLRTWKLTPVVVADLLKARRGPSRGTRELWVWPTLEELERFASERIAGSSALSIDLETLPAWGQVQTVGLGASGASALVIPFVDWKQIDRSYWRTVDAEVKVWEFIQRHVEGPLPKIMQNGAYDTFWLWMKHRIAVNNWQHDTRLLQHALYPEMRKDLGLLGSLYDDVPAWKSLKTKEGEKRDG